MKTDLLKLFSSQNRIVARGLSAFVRQSVDRTTVQLCHNPAAVDIMGSFRLHFGSPCTFFSFPHPNKELVPRSLFSVCLSHLRTFHYMTECPHRKDELQPGPLVFRITVRSFIT